MDRFGEAGFDVASMAKTSTKVFVMEVMGRHAGWIAAAGGLAANAPDEGELAALKSKAEGGAMEDRLAYAEAAFAGGKRDEAADELLAMIEADNQWNEGAARAKLLQIFEAVGLEDPWVVATRRRLSRILFG